MRDPGGATLAVAFLVALAGCSLPTGGPASPSATPTPFTPEPEPYPPGLSADGVENGTTLFRTHVDAITATGYTAAGAVNTTVRRSGFLIEVQTQAEIAVEPNATRYLDQRRVVGGPIERREAYWSNGSVEIVRRVEGGEPEYERGDPRSPRRIAGRRLLLPYLTGGEFVVESSNESAGRRTVTLVATSMSDPEAVRRGLPEAAESIESFRAHLVVDGEQIRSLEADIEFSIEGTNRTHHVAYELVDTGDVAVEQPDWVDDAMQRTGTPGTATDASFAPAGTFEPWNARRPGSPASSTVGPPAVDSVLERTVVPARDARPAHDGPNAGAAGEQSPERREAAPGTVEAGARAVGTSRDRSYAGTGMTSSR